MLDSFCTDYTPVVRKANDVKPLALDVKKRILSNELKHEQNCK